MNTIRSTFDPNAPLLWGALVLLVILIAVWALRIHRRTSNLQSRLDTLLGDVGNPNTGQMLAEYLSTVRHTASVVENMRAEHEQIVRQMPSVLSHIGLVRFSPFHDTGGDQSFTLALLDAKGDGVVITGLHSRHDSRLYAKPIERRSSSYSLTPEECQAMDQALAGQTVQPRA